MWTESHNNNITELYDIIYSMRYLMYFFNVYQIM
jgi:hypothetical protein